MARRFEHDQLIAADPGMPIRHGSRAFAVDRNRIAARVEHDKIIAEAVHLQKRHLPHGPAYMAARPACPIRPSSTAGLKTWA